MQYHFILVHPARGENVGFSARALKAYGLDSLLIVGDKLQDSVAARKTAYGAHDILDAVKNYPTLAQAIFDMDLTIGTTSKRRIKRYDNHTPQEITNLLDTKEGILKQIGLVFGSEESGLSTAELDLCDLVSTIPLQVAYPSLNLAQSVLIYAWELTRIETRTRPRQHNVQLQKQLIVEMVGLLDELGLSEKPLLKRRIMDRVALLSADDSALMMVILNKLKRG